MHRAMSYCGKAVIPCKGRMVITTVKNVVRAAVQWKASTHYCYLDGAIVPMSEAKIGIGNIGLLRGFGIYEGLITHNRKPFMLGEHMERLHRSAQKMDLKIPASDAKIEAAVNELVERNVPKEKEALIRIIITGGETVGVIDYNVDTPTMFILVGEFTPLEHEYVEQGCSVMPVEYHRDLAEIKSINYIKTVLLQKERRAKKTLEILYTWQGKVLEGGGSNVFIVKNGILITPKDEIVLGITRKVVLDLAREHFKIEERPVSVDELYNADEVFLTGSFKEVVGVVKVGDKIIADGKVGPITKKVMELFHDFSGNY